MFVFLLILWIIFNGRVTAEILVIGALVSLAVCLFLTKFAGYSFKRELKLIRLIPDLVAYIIILIAEIIKANFALMGIVLFKKKDSIDPVFVRFTTGLRSRFLRVILANSITLTPGTITASLSGDEYCVHCLDRSFAEGIDSSVFVRRLEKMEARL